MKVIADSIPGVRACRDLTLKRLNGRLKLNLCCQFDKDLSVREVHNVVEHLESVIKSKHPSIEPICVHT